MPHVEKHYRVQTDRASTAIAGLSMGGAQTLSVAIPRLKPFGYVGVFSSGLLNALPVGRGRGAGPAPAAASTPPAAAEWEKANAAYLADAKSKAGLRLFWFSTGKDDFLIENTRATVALFKQHQYQPVYVESTGGHTWINWRNYLTEFAPQLFSK
jgi:enterochelin esterase family protein